MSTDKFQEYTINKIYNIDLKKENIWQKYCKNKQILPSILPRGENDIIVFGDVHGDWTIIKRTLENANLIEKNPNLDLDNYENNLNWIGGDTIIVQLGDQVDNCRLMANGDKNCVVSKNGKSNDIKILYFFTFLNDKAMEEGGAVYSLLGNHELMNFDGDDRYNSTGNNIIEFNNYSKKNKKNGLPKNFGEFLGCTRLAILKIGEYLFVHAGLISEIINKYKNIDFDEEKCAECNQNQIANNSNNCHKQCKGSGIETINKIVRLYLFNILDKTDQNNFDDLLTYNDNSPFWTREYMKCKKIDSMNKCKESTNNFKSWKIGKIFVGHSPQIQEGITALCNERIYLTDYGSSNAFNHVKDSNNIQFIKISKKDQSDEVEIFKSD